MDVDKCIPVYRMNTIVGPEVANRAACCAAAVDRERICPRCKPYIARVRMTEKRVKDDIALVLKHRRNLRSNSLSGSG